MIYTGMLPHIMCRALSKHGAYQAGKISTLLKEGARWQEKQTDKLDGKFGKHGRDGKKNVAENPDKWISSTVRNFNPSTGLKIKVFSWEPNCAFISFIKVLCTSNSTSLGRYLKEP